MFQISGDRSSASPRPPGIEQRRATLGAVVMAPLPQHLGLPQNLAPPSIRPQATPAHLGSLPYLVSPTHHMAVKPSQVNTLGHPTTNWQRPHGTMPATHIHNPVSFF